MAAWRSSVSTLWHQRYGHLNVHWLDLGLPEIQTQHLGVCDACQGRKQHRTTFTSGDSWLASQVLRLVHADICGPMATPSILGSMYFLLFVDDFSRKMSVYFLKKKSDAFPVFQKFKPLVEKESWKSIITLRSNNITLRSDNGREFCSNAFSSFLDTHGIKCQLTTPHTPQQNSVVERRNRTIAEMAHSMLEHRHLPKQFWAEAVNTAVYLLNRSLTVAVKGKTPKEAWLGRKPKISHLKVFGSLAFVWILDASRTKLDAKSQKMMLAGYSSLHKAYHLIDVEASRHIYNCDVVFDEQRGPFMPVSPVLDPADQPMMARDLGVRLPLGPPDGRAPVALAAPVIPVIPIQTPPASRVGSPCFVDASPEFDPASSDEDPADQASPSTAVGHSPIKPKWWAKTLADLRDDELIDGRIARKKSKTTDSVNFALMANIHSVFEPQTYSEAKEIPEWEQAMTSEDHSLLKNNTWSFQIFH